MIHLTVEGVEREYEEGTLLKVVSEEFQHQFPYDILLAIVDGKLQELHKKVKEGSCVRFLTAQDKPGQQTYQRSAILIMMKAIYDVIGAEQLTRVSMEFSIGNGLFVNPEGTFEWRPELVEQIKAKMQEYVERRIPIMKRSVNTDEAVELFHKHQMYDKELLFKYRRVSRVNIYSIGGFEDYYYGYMVQNTGYVRYFDLQPYQYGMLLLLPTQ